MGERERERVTNKQLICSSEGTFFNVIIKLNGKASEGCHKLMKLYPCYLNQIQSIRSFIS